MYDMSPKGLNKFKTSSLNSLHFTTLCCVPVLTTKIQEFAKQNFLNFFHFSHFFKNVDMINVDVILNNVLLRS